LFGRLLADLPVDPPLEQPNEWYRLRLVVKDGRATIMINGHVVHEEFHTLSLQFGRVATILTFVDCQSGKSATFGFRSTRKEVPGVPAVSCSADVR
jgi:hypothetical protein